MEKMKPQQKGSMRRVCQVHFEVDCYRMAEVHEKIDRVMHVSGWFYGHGQRDCSVLYDHANHAYAVHKMKQQMPLALSALSLFSLSSCINPSDKAVSDTVSLHQPALASRWQVQEREDGVRYVDPQSSLTFLYIRKKAGPGPVLAQPPLIQPMYAGETPQPPPGKAQTWKSTQILGQNVRWYQEDEGSGADFPAFVTEVFPVTNKQGKREYYQIIVCHGMQGNYTREIDAWMRDVTLR